MRIRIANAFLLASLLWPFCWSLGLAQAPVVFKGINSAAVGFSPDGRWLAAAGQKPAKAGDSNFIPASGLVKVWEISTGKEVFHHVEDHWEATSLAFSPTPPLLAVGLNDRPRAKVVIDKEGIRVFYDEKMPPVPVKLWNLKTLKEHRCFLHDEHGDGGDNIRSISFSPDGHTLATANSKLHFWDVETGMKRFTISEFNWFPHRIAFFPAGRILAASTVKPRLNLDQKLEFVHAVEVWDVGAKKRTASFSVLDSRVLAFSRDGLFVAFAAGLEDKTVRIYDMRRQEVVTTFQTYTMHFMCVAFSPDSKTLYTGGSDGKVGQLEGSWKAWDASTGRLLHTQKSPLTSTNVLAVSPDGQRLATGGRDGMVRLWTLPKDFGKSTPAHGG
jgi:WD40 repeat protein